MLNAKNLKKQLTLKNITQLMKRLHAEPERHGKTIQSRTVCHNGDSHKLYYYDNRKLFVCYTNCGSFDIYELLQKIYGVDFKQAFKWITSFFNVKDHPGRLVTSTIEDPVEVYKKEIERPALKKLPQYPKSILDHYDNIAYVNWIREGISPATLRKYQIKLSIPDEEIIIPEFDQDDRLIGVRCRHLDKRSLAAGKKYTPVNFHGKELKYPTGQILYGLNFNQKAINRYHKVILFEAEKSVMKLDSAVGSKNISVGLNGSNLTNQQVRLLENLHVNEVMVALDKEFKHPFTRSERIYAEQIESEFYRLKKFANLSVVWDSHDRLDYKDSPIDKGLKTFKQLIKERMFL